MSEELKPCPFCGGKGDYYYIMTMRKHWIGCSNCNCATDGYDTEEEAIEAWNTRAKDANYGLADLIEPEPINGETSDGYHTFNELYHHRALLFSVIVRNYPELCWKSKKHHTGDMYEGMFIVGINTPDGQASYHYDIDPYWDMFDCEELEFAPEWDGHTPDQAIERIGKLTRHDPERTCKIDGTYDDEFGIYDHLSCGHVAMRQWPEKTSYCPNCGAKVVE